MESKSGYKLAPLLFWVLGGILLFVTWSLCDYWRPDDMVVEWWSCPFNEETVCVFWQRIDNAVFFTFNGSLGMEKNTWNLVWAVANNRAFDMLAIVFMFVILLMYGREADDKEELKRRIGIILGCIVYIVISSLIIRLVSIHFDRHSATIVHEKSATLLGNLYPGLDPKDTSQNSFPGDHAIILLGFVVAMFRYGKFKYGVAAAIITLVFTLPRLVGGAHWFTDIAVGSSFVIMISMSLFFYTPLYMHFEKASIRVINSLPLVDAFAAKLARK